MRGRISRKSRRRLKRAAPPGLRSDSVPGPSTNPATNLLIADVAMRGASILFRHAMERGLLRSRFDSEKARDIARGRTMAQSVIAFGVSRIATRSVPGLLLVGGGLLAKAAFERGGSKRAARRKGERQLHEMAETTREREDRD